jgi:selenocysteine lyase/cysteine desulfurase
MENIEKVREQFPITKNKAFLNHAAQSPLPKPVADVMRKCIDEQSNLGTTSVEWNDGGKPCFAKLIGAGPGEIAFVENTSMGLNIVANMLQYPHGSKVVTTDLEYPSAVYPWLRKRLGVRVHYVKNVEGKILLDDMEKAVDDKTVAVVVSHVEYANGFRHNLKVLSEIAHDHGAYLIVDAIQSVGTMLVDAKRDDVDFLTLSCYKWLLSPPGVGYLYVKDDLIEKFEPPFVGWASVNQEIFETADMWDIYEMPLAKTASRFEAGTPSYPSLTAADTAMKMLLDFGVENIHKRIVLLTDHLIENIKRLRLEVQTPLEKHYRSGIVNFKIREPGKVVEKLKKKGIVVSARDNGIRVSPHFYNTETEINKLVKEIKALKG